MRWQGRNLRAGISGPDVVELHDELTRLGYQVPEAERTQRMFGVGTAEAVAAFQVAHGLVDTAVVDKNTAAVLDRATAELQTTHIQVKPPEPQVGRAAVHPPVLPVPPTAMPVPPVAPPVAVPPVA